MTTNFRIILLMIAAFADAVAKIITYTAPTAVQRWMVMGMADIRYAVKRRNRWLQGIEPNSNYVGSGTAPTMGTRYTYSEFKTVWGNEQATFERLTFANYIKVLTEEYRWGDLKPMDFTVVTVCEEKKK